MTTLIHRINKDGQPRKPKPSALDNLDHIWAQAIANFRQAQGEKQRCERAMLEAGQRAQRGGQTV